MRYFVDEAGSFAVPSEPRHAVGVAVGVAVSDIAFPRLVADFRRFRDSLPKRSFTAKGELKGRLMTSGQLNRFTSFLSKHPGLTIAPVTMDLGRLGGMPATSLLGAFHDRLDLTAAAMVYPEAKEQMDLLAKQVRNLSLPQVLRIQTWTRCLYETIFHSIIFLSHGPYAQSWKEVRIEVDPVQPRGSREELVLRILLYAWMTAWTTKDPFVTVAAIHTPDHPFVRNFTSTDGVVLSDLIRPNLYWPSSADSEGLQIADVAATIVYQATLKLDDSDGAISRYHWLMRSSDYGPARGPGLISPLPSTGSEAANRYSVLLGK